MHRNDYIEKRSRLGDLLVSKGVATQEQIDMALCQKEQSGRMLGAELVAMDVLSEKQLQRALKRQSRVRVMLALVTSLFGTFQPMVGHTISHSTQDFNTEAAQDPLSSNAIEDLEHLYSESMNQTIREHNLQPLAHGELRDIEGQGFGLAQFSPNMPPMEQLNNLLTNATPETSEQLSSIMGLIGSGQLTDGKQITQLINAIFPLSQLFEADVSISGVQYSTNSEGGLALNSDGSFTLTLPKYIDEIRFDNFRVKGAQTSFGDVALLNIDLSKTEVRISLH